MSRGFVKEEDQEEAPFIPPRAALPSGVTNYVTPVGHELLLAERVKLEKERTDLDISTDKERRHALAVIDGKLNLLNQRISTSRVINLKEQPQDEVRFGAKVNFEILKENLKGKKKVFQIVGVDEANIKENKIAFVAPLAKALTGKKIGEKTQVLMAGEVQLLKVISIEY